MMRWRFSNGPWGPWGREGGVMKAGAVVEFLGSLVSQEGYLGSQGPQNPIAP